MLQQSVGKVKGCFWSKDVVIVGDAGTRSLLGVEKGKWGNSLVVIKGYLIRGRASTRDARLRPSQCGRSRAS